MNKNIILISLLLFVALSSSKLFSGDRKLVGELYPGQKSYWFETQLLDHFSQQPTPYWRQRYTVYEDDYDQQDGPLIMYVGGEGPADGISTKSAFPIQLAKQYKGIVITLEHRFYGESQPFGQVDDAYSLEHLRYLTHQQALADLAYFIGYAKESGLHGLKVNTPVITIGGSYPGALSAWFRYKYKHVTIGSIASSAVVNAIDDYQQFDFQIRVSVDVYEGCQDKIQNLVKYAENQLFNTTVTESQQFKDFFGAGELDDYDFLYFFADVFALQVQYGATTELCTVQLASDEVQDQLNGLQNYAKTSLNPNDYNQEYIKNDLSYGKAKNIRQWTYQTCTYFGWFYTAAFIEPMRSRLIDINYFHNLCQNVYGEEYLPDTKLTNQIMGGTKLSAENLIFTNGIQDPWRWASVQKDQPPMQSYVVNCVDCAHCVDLHTYDPENNPQELTDVQQQVFQQVDKWIVEYRSQQEKQNKEYQWKLIEKIFTE